MFSGPDIPFPLLCSVLCCLLSSPFSNTVKCRGRGQYVSFGAFLPTQRLLFPTLPGFRLQGRTSGLGGADSIRELSLEVLGDFLLLD